MNQYSLLCIIYQIVNEEDRKQVLELVSKQESFKNLSFGTVTEGKYQLELLCHQLSKAQKLMIYNYGYLYQCLKGSMGIVKFAEKWGRLLQLEKADMKTIEKEWSEERVNYIKNRCKEKQYTSVQCIVEPEEYIEEFITKLIEQLLVEVYSTDIDEREAGRITQRIILTNLDAMEYEHPEDHRLLEVLRGNKMLEAPLKLFVEYDIERFIKVQYTGSNIKVTPTNMPYIYEAVKTACRILNLNKMPDVYVQQGFQINGCTTGIENPIIILNAGCLSLLDYDELLFIIGHEIGHIKSQHLMYHMMGQALPYLAEIAAQMTLGFGSIIGAGIQISLYNWYRKSELTADRAGLLVCQSHKAAIKALMKCAGYPPQFYGHMNEMDFLKQMEQFENLDSEAYNKVVKVLSSLYQTHPWTVLRAKELHEWYKQGEYDQIISRKICLTKER